MKTLDKTVIIKELETSWQGILDWCVQQPDKNFNEPQAQGKWSAAQTLYHLSKITRQINGGFKAPKLVLRGMFGKSKRTEKNYAEIVEHFVNLMNAGSVSPSKYVAAEDRVFEKEVLVKRFSNELKDLKKHLGKWDEKNLSQYILPHPEIDKSTAREILYYTIWHTKHHLVILQERASSSSVV